MKRAPRPEELENNAFEMQQNASKALKEREEKIKKLYGGPRKFDVIGNYLKEQLKQTHLMEKTKHGFQSKHLYSSNSIPAHSLAIRKNDLFFKVKYTGDIPVQGIRVYLKDCVMPDGCRWDLPVSFVSVCSRKYTNHSEHVLASSFSVNESHKAYRNVDEPLIEAAEHLGGLKYASATFLANQKDKKGDVYFLHVQQVTKGDGQVIKYHYGNPDFMASTFKIAASPFAGPYLGKTKDECTQEEIKAFESGELKGTNQSLWNGLIRIPGDVCKKANYPIYDEEKAREAHLLVKEHRMQLTKQDDNDAMDTNEDDDEIPETERLLSPYLNVDDDLKTRCWYAMNPDHILSWTLTTSLDQRKSCGVYSERFDVTINEKRILAYYMIPDTVLRGLIRSFKSVWEDRVDVRENALESVYFTIAPSNRKQGYLKNVSIEFTVHCYVIWWKPVPENTELAPVLHPNFPAFVNFVNSPFDDLSEQMNKLNV